jgi:type 1 glutamine amidotransferase
MFASNAIGRYRFRNSTLTAIAAALCIFSPLLTIAADSQSSPVKKIVFLAGPLDHGGGGRHEYERDLRTLAASFDAATNISNIKTEVHVGTLPRDLALIEDAAVIVINSSSDRAADETHPLFPPNPTTNGRGYDEETTAYLERLDKLLQEKQIGVVVLHYALWAENWRAREQYMKWLGGLWVQIGSKNPVDEWAITFEAPQHPILRGVKPWTFRDEIFCRFLLPNDARRTNLLRASPKEDRGSIGPQIASWAYERTDGGRGFAFGGQDFRDNLARDDYRRFLMNGIAWAARIEIPPEGIQSPTPDVSDVSPRRVYAR